MQRLQLSQNLVQSLRQEQIMAPQQIQALEILLATMPELEQKISDELAENPTLELIERGIEKLIGNPVEGDGHASDDGEAAALAAEKDEALATLIQLNETWQDYTPSPTSQGGGSSQDDQEKHQFLLNSLVSEPTFLDFMLSQLRQTEDLDEKTVELCEHIIGSIDDSGYLRTHPRDIATTLQADLSEVNRALAIVQSFDPAGVGARDLRECLLLQLERQNRKESLVYRVVDQHLEDIGRNQIPKVTRALHTSSNQLYQALDEIRALNPYPGSTVRPNDTGFVYPEIFIEKDDDGKWQVRSNRECSPRLRISAYYLKLLEDPNTTREVKAYVREKITSSKMLMRAISQRRSTIERIAESLVNFQEDFLERGVQHMRPLIMSQVADEIGVHETTVSRAIANKYVQTPHGLFPFKHFFSSGYAAQNGETVSSLSIKQKIQDLINGEDDKHPLSDQKLAAMLREQGFKVARRTVAKYREELGVLPSHMRRSY